jgi:hypothetical protein
MSTADMTGPDCQTHEDRPEDRPLTSQQARVRQRARALLHALDQAAPPYPKGPILALTEETRPAIVKLIREAHTLPAGSAG